MITRSFAELVRDLKTRRAVADRPPVLLLGAGASVEAGIGAMPELMEFFGCRSFDEFCRYIATTSATERYRYLSQFLQTRAPSEVSPGYHALAALCAQNYFDLVLTTNMDPLLDDALAAARLWRRDYLLLVNGVVRPDRFAPLLGGQSPRVKVVKLHGDLFQRHMAWTVEEMDGFVGEVASLLDDAVQGRDFLVVGYSLRDAQVRALVERAGGAVWFTHPSTVPSHLNQAPGPALARFRAVLSPDCAFERLFPALAAALDVEVASPPAPTPAAGGAGVRAASTGRTTLAPAHPVSGGNRSEVRAPPAATRAGKHARPGVAFPPAALVPTEPTEATGATGAPATATPVALGGCARTLDDVIAATLAVAGADGRLSATAFLLAEPRVIVCDAFAAGAAVRGGELTLIAADGRRLNARQLNHPSGHPFGPLLFEAPATLRIPGIRLSCEPLGTKTAVQVFVAAGERVGIGAGTVTDVRLPPQEIQPLRQKVRDLVALACHVAPGSSGAPVVDADLAVRGLVVASNANPADPLCFAYPAAAWTKVLPGARSG